MEAIKGAVQYGLGAAFISSAAITKELDLGLFKRIDISGVRLNRTLSLVRLLCLPNWYNQVAAILRQESIHTTHVSGPVHLH